MYLWLLLLVWLVGGRHGCNKSGRSTVRRQASRCGGTERLQARHCHGWLPANDAFCGRGRMEPP